MNASRISHHLSRLRDARAHIECALMQVVPTDDQIIVGHMRSASAELLATIRELQAARDEQRPAWMPELDAPFSSPAEVEAFAAIRRSRGGAE